MYGSTTAVIPGFIRVALDAADKNWSEINPSIMGTLFERGLDPGKRSQLGAHYTDAEKIMMIVRPVIIEPLLREWEAARETIAGLMLTAKTHKARAERTKAENAAKELKTAFFERLKNFRVLDPACGSGNFLYLALKSLKDIEARVNIEAESLGLPPAFPSVGPECVKGIEINPFAAELARVSVWIGEIQWMREHNFSASKNPILKPLTTIECRDALLNPDGTEAEWPEADVIIGNPPFLGDRKITTELGESYAKRLRETFSAGIDGSVDLVCYWFDKGRRQISAKRSEACGLVATNSIRGGVNRQVLEAISQHLHVFNAWSDEPWILDGAAVRVSIVCFGADASLVKRLDGAVAQKINPDLSALNIDLSLARSLPANSKIAFNGIQKTGPFEIDEDVAREWLTAPTNPNGSRNSDVLRPYWNGIDVTRRLRGSWIVDFGLRSVSDAALYERPFEYANQTIRPVREASTVANPKDREWLANNWWVFWRARPEMATARARFARVIVTPEVAKHRLFAWAPSTIGVDKNLIAIARDDDTTFGILHSKFHELWSLRLGTSLEDRPRYTPTTCFETYPFPEGLTPNIAATDYASDPRAIAIAKAAHRLNELRENWLNPPDLVQRVPEVVPGYPDRILPVDDKAAAILKNRTLTKLYNERLAGGMAWLDHTHKDLDAAVASAYGWPGDLSDDAILERLFALNQMRAAKP